MGYVYICKCVKKEQNSDNYNHKSTCAQRPEILCTEVKLQALCNMAEVQNKLKTRAKYGNKMDKDVPTVFGRTCPYNPITILPANIQNLDHQHTKIFPSLHRFHNDFLKRFLNLRNF